MAHSVSAPLLVASTRDGVTLPVIDVTDPRFVVPDDAANLARLFAQASAEEQRNLRLPKFIMRFLLKRAARRSLLVRALFGGEGLFFATLTGPGRVWLQSLPCSRLAGRMLAAAVAAGFGRGDEGSALGGFGLGS